MTPAAILPAAERPILDRFGFIMAGLRAAVAAHFRAPGMSGALVLLICRRLRRVEDEVLAVVARIVAGTLRPSRARPRPHGGPDASMPLPVPVPVPVREARPSGPALPRGFAWLCRLVPYQAAGCGTQLHSLLAEPEMAALIEATPRLARALRPLCRMLAVEGFAWLKPIRRNGSPGREHPAPRAAGDPVMAWGDTPGSDTAESDTAESDKTGGTTESDARWSDLPPGTVSADVWLSLPEPVWPAPPDIPVRLDAEGGGGPAASGPDPGLTRQG